MIIFLFFLRAAKSATRERINDMTARVMISVWLPSPSVVAASFELSGVVESLVSASSS
ncbi:hypothetical protein RCO48_02765 [Peribacillus frigoritolerans]|nr:hypothetical protein [Peribacillus frigoritolerans]